MSYKNWLNLMNIDFRNVKEILEKRSDWIEISFYDKGFEKKYKHKLIHNYHNYCIWLVLMDEIDEINSFEKKIADEYHKIDLKTIYEYNEYVKNIVQVMNGYPCNALFFSKFVSNRFLKDLY